MEMETETEMATEMETETLDPSPSSSAAKRFGIKNAIQTNFGDDYVFQIAASQDSSTLAVSLSSNAIKLYSPETGQYFGECKGHRGTINEISYSIPSSPNVICSCSSDATIRAWDTRTFKQVSSLKAGSYQEIFSFSFGGSSGNLLAAGCNAQILFWDWRNGKRVACLEESHMDDVTQVQFVPDQQNKLISSSVDGLLCLFDTNGQIDDDNHLEMVMNVGTSIAKIGFFGQMNQKLWCLTHIETLSIWDWKETRREVNFEDARSLASGKWNLDDVIVSHVSSSKSDDPALLRSFSLRKFQLLHCISCRLGSYSYCHTVDVLRSCCTSWPHAFQIDSLQLNSAAVRAGLLLKHSSLA